MGFISFQTPAGFTSWQICVRWGATWTANNFLKKLTCLRVCVWLHTYWLHYGNYHDFTGETQEDICNQQRPSRNEQWHVLTKDHYRDKIVLPARQ